MTRRFAEHLAAHGDDIAVLTDDRELTYRQLCDEVAGVAAEFGSRRRLVMIETRNDLATLVAYLGALVGDHVVLPLPADHDHSAIVGIYEPDVVVTDGVIEHRHDPSRELHPDLSLLLSTSGSTGSPKLVRLTHDNLHTNATAIARYLDIRQSDRAATTLPMSYCYGLSVIHSHLLTGAGIILTDDSVVDDHFWESFQRHRGTTFAGVPHTFDLLDRIGFEDMSLPSLRNVTQAGGRLAPEQVRRFATLGQSRGWQLFVMYGATEATARMAYLPPELAVEFPTCIGRPIAGGSFTIKPVDGVADGTGELVYHGPNVMMGYANGPADLALGTTVDVLRTGDIGKQHANGLYEVVGRRNRFAKMYGLRIDLQRVEDSLRADGVTAICTDGDGVLLIAAAARPDGCDVQRAAAAAAGLPPTAIRVVDVAEIPVLANGKPDYRGVRELARRPEPEAPEALDLRSLFADVLQVNVSDVDLDRSFVDLGGNSLSYVSMSVRLERALGHLPTDWQRLPVRDLQATIRPHRRRWWGATLETSVALRASAIVLVVGSHAELWTLWGGAHILLGIAGYNFGRFCLTPVPRVDRVRHLRNTVAWIAVPSLLWIVFALLVTDDYAATNLLLANKFLGPSDSMTAGRLWFVEVIVWILVGLVIVCWMPVADLLERRWPFGFAVAFLAIGLALRYDALGFGVGQEAWFTMLAFWFFAVGWAAAKASHAWQRLAVTVALAVSIFGYFGNPDREILVFAGLALLIWLPAIRCPAAFTVTTGLVAEASLYVYLTHFQVYPLFGEHKALGVLASVAVGVVLTQLMTLLRRQIRDRMPLLSRFGAAPRVRSSPIAPRVRSSPIAPRVRSSPIAPRVRSSPIAPRVRGRRLFPLRNEPLLSQGGSDGAVGADQAGGDQPPATSRRRRSGLQEVPFVGTDGAVKPDR
jgi:acyl-CoA synthetase (AMP-forming)/AMP-acid ligase II